MCKETAIVFCFDEHMIFSISSVYKTVLDAISLHTTHPFQLNLVSLHLKFSVHSWFDKCCGVDLMCPSKHSQVVLHETFQETFARYLICLQALHLRKTWLLTLSILLGPRKCRSLPSVWVFLGKP